MATRYYEETFRSPFEQSTESDALKVLDKIRASHPASSGWEELEAYAEQLPNGKWIAVRRHQKAI